MYIAEQELFGQHVAVRQTYAFMEGRAGEIKDFFGVSGFYSMSFTGCGMMYALCKSAELCLRMRGGLSAMSFAAGDLAINMPMYRNMLSGTLMLASSRSGGSNEVLQAVEKAGREAGASSIGITTRTDTKLSGISDMCLEMPWAADAGVCATRSAVCLYLANLYTVALLAGDNDLLKEIKDAANDQEAFIDRYAAELEGIGQAGTWNRMLILADGELGGVAEAGAKTLLRLCGLPAVHSHMLDVRHGDIALVDDRTLVVAAVSPTEDVAQSVLLHEIGQMGAQIVTLSGYEENIYGGRLNVTLPPTKAIAVRGLPMLFVLQAIAYFRAVGDGRNPDKADSHLLP